MARDEHEILRDYEAHAASLAAGGRGGRRRGAEYPLARGIERAPASRFLQAAGGIPEAVADSVVSLET